jgi:hypothetical protein
VPGRYRLKQRKSIAMAGIKFDPQINFDMESQQGGNLCWIAIAVSVKRHFESKSTLRQCELVGTLPPAGAAGAKVTPGFCCTAAAQAGEDVPRACDFKGRLDVALGTSGVRHLRSFQEGILTFAEVQSEIDQGLPVCAFISFLGEKDGHFILISGHNVVNGVQYLYVKDPLFRDGIHPYDRVVSKYHFIGEWKFTYKLKKG